MATYKVPQDVEAEDKLLGPFSFRQFIYLMIVAGAIGLGVLLFNLHPFLVIIPLPVVLFFGTLALPLRKDQPMELYLAAILSFHLKPRLHFWDPDGTESLIQITAPKDTEIDRVKSVSQTEAGRRLRYLSEISDSRGWSVRGVQNPSSNRMNEDVFNEAQQTTDILDDNSQLARNFDQMIETDRQTRHQAMLDQFRTAATAPQEIPSSPTPQPPNITTTPPTPAGSTASTIADYSAPQATPAPQANTAVQQIVTAPVQQPHASATESPQPQPQHPTAPASDDSAGLQFNPYPTSMNQSVIQPLSEQATATQQPLLPDENQSSTSDQPVSPDIINLANNSDLSIETIAREAERINKKKVEEGEVYISLR